MRLVLLVAVLVSSLAMLGGCASGAEDESTKPVTSTAEENKGASGIGEAGAANANANGGGAGASPMKGPSND